MADDNLIDDFYSFGFAMLGLDLAVHRLDSGDSAVAPTVIEIAWWISAAANACKHNKDGDILHGFWWIRSKGSHGTAIAYDVLLLVDPDPEVDRAVDWGERLWQPLPERFESKTGDDAPAAYVTHLEDRSVRGTIGEAHEKLRAYWAEASEKMMLRGS